ncbi:PorT family protein [Crocinitomicaceae bacterium]|nr:PorT family protein [Crocinitomicaceae bacterium]MDB4075651.1 PorT family protein [Crocinitomicaceae bacterium]
MNKLKTIIVAMLFAAPVFSQVEEEAQEGEVIITVGQITIIEEGEGEPDTTKMKVGNKEIIIITHPNEDFDLDSEDDSEDESPKRKRKSDAHWAGVDLGFTILMNDNFNTDFATTPYWKNDPARSIVWNLNLLEHKFNFGTPFVGLTTGVGFSFTSVAFRDGYIINSSADSLFAVLDTVNTYSKNKLKASYLTIPLLLEFNTNTNSDKNFYLAAGVVGGVRMTSKIKRNGEFADGKEFEEREKGTYSLSPFKLDAALRMGYGSFGVFANYSLLPLFESGKTVEVYPLTFGLSLNF